MIWNNELQLQFLKSQDSSGDLLLDLMFNST